MDYIQVVVLNPVIESLLGENYQKLIKLLQDKGLHVKNAGRGKEFVKTFYGSHIYFSSRQLFLDSRCPKIFLLINREFEHLAKYLVPVNPILMTGSYIALNEVSEKNPCDKIYSTIVSPCTAMNIYNTSSRQIITWLELKKLYGIDLPEIEVADSPVPLGFFDSITSVNKDLTISSVSGEKKCRNFLSNLRVTQITTGKFLAELLWCEGGCHKGDGL